MTSATSPAARYLDALGLPYRLFRHTQLIRSLEQAATERGQSPQQVVRSIVFRLNESEYVMVLAAGPGQLPWQALRKFFGTSRMSMADPQTVLELTGYATGTVNPFVASAVPGQPLPLPVVVEVGVLEQRELSIGSGVRDLAIILPLSSLLAGLGEYRSAHLFAS